METRKEHWGKIYETNNPDQLSWIRRVPQLSPDFIHSFGLAKTTKITDMGARDIL
ncbi:MAG: hypothetical protein JJE22_19740 [Bacteroidia bacterium]|nr:hypothetical protein [Bacteroidia bacterium]